MRRRCGASTRYAPGGVRAKEWVLDDASSETNLFFVLHGYVRVVIAAAGQDVILRGILVGKLAAIDRQPRSAGILAITDALVPRRQASVFPRVLHGNADVCDQVPQMLVGQIRTLPNRANKHFRLGVRHRLYAELLRLAPAPAAGNGQAVVSPPPTHAELAARVSSHREATTREMNALARRGVIERRRGAIALLDVARLREMVAQAGEA